MCPTTSSSSSSSHSSIFPARPISDLHSAFTLLDADRDGRISHHDLKTSYSDADDDVIGAMITLADSNNDGFVEYEEFEKVLEGNGGNASWVGGGVLEDAFKAMDGDGDGKVGYGDLRAYLGSAGLKVDDDEIKAMLKLGGENEDEDDGVTFDGFLKILAL